VAYLASGNKRKTMAPRSHLWFEDHSLITASVETFQLVFTHGKFRPLTFVRRYFLGRRHGGGGVRPSAGRGVIGTSAMGHPERDLKHWSSDN
jgi:hypothetical protein